MYVCHNIRQNNNMEKNRRIFYIVLIVMFLTASVYAVKSTQTEYINIIVGKETSVDLNSLTGKLFLSQKEKIVEVNGQLSEDYEIDPQKKLIFCSEKEGVFDFTVNILYRVPIKHIKVNVLPDTCLYVGGELIGVKLDTLGVIAVGFEKISAADNNILSPAKEAGIREGDIIKSINGIEVNKASEVKELLNTLSNDDIEFIILRSNKLMSVKISPVQDITDNVFKATPHNCQKRKEVI